ncbi:MAG: amidohydrolase family protein [Clostridia bacterium]|nr:amidohydrolase family protein [Clostridia bacterium]
MTVLKSRRIITPGGLVDGYIAFDRGSIICAGRQKPYGAEAIDLGDLYVSPGFIDMHTHGAGGHPFLDSSPEDVAAACNLHLRHGTTTILPTLSAAPFDVMKKSAADIKTAAGSPATLSRIAGAHLEGPFLSPRQCGAQSCDFITPPDPGLYLPFLDRFQECVARWTYAPEYDPDGSFCREASRRGILMSAGHTDATLEDMITAAENGCRLVTHLYSCTSTVTRKGGFRSLGVIESAFLMDVLSVEIIADGRHLPPELIKMILKVKGTDKTALITDSLDIAGTDIKSGSMSGVPFIVEDGVCKLSDRSAFAGSVATADMLIRVLTKDCGLPVADAVKMMTEVPAGILGLNRGRLEAGREPDLIVFDDDINVSRIFVKGKEVQWQKKD